MTLARSSCDFPDAVGERCVMSISVPEAVVSSALLEVWLLGAEPHCVQMPLEELPQVAEAKEYVPRNKGDLLVLYGL